MFIHPYISAFKIRSSKYSAYSGTLLNNLSYYYEFNQNVLKTVGTNDGVGVNVTYEPDTQGYRMVCDGTTRALIDESSDFDLGAGDFTINVDVIRSNTDVLGYVFGQCNALGQDDSVSYLLQFGADNKLGFWFRDAGDNWFNLTTTATYTTGVKYVIVIRKTGNDYEMYVNNTLVATDNWGIKTMHASVYKMGLAQLGEYVGDNLVGKICVFRGWSRALDASEMTDLYNSGNGFKW